jgi:hypothetical protein
LFIILSFCFEPPGDGAIVLNVPSRNVPAIHVSGPTVSVQVRAAWSLQNPDGGCADSGVGANATAGIAASKAATAAIPFSTV